MKPILGPGIMFSSVETKIETETESKQLEKIDGLNEGIHYKGIISS